MRDRSASRFAPTGQRTREWIQNTAGTITRPSVSWSQSLVGNETSDDDFRLRNADSARIDEMPRVTVTEQEVRAITPNDLNRWCANQRIALVRLVTDQGLARYGGTWIPTLMNFHISAEEYRDRLNRPWPISAGTIAVPFETDYDRRFKDGPGQSVAKQQLEQKIRKLRERRKNSQ